MDVVVVGVTFAFQLLYYAASSVQNEKGGGARMCLQCTDMTAKHTMPWQDQNRVVVVEGKAPNQLSYAIILPSTALAFSHFHPRTTSSHATVTSPSSLFALRRRMLVLNITL